MATSTVQHIKLMIAQTTGLSKDALHIYAGLLAFLLCALLLAKPLRSPAPWLAALGIAILGEVLDCADDLHYLGYWQWQASLHDIINTAFWPTAIYLLARFKRLNI